MRAASLVFVFAGLAHAAITVATVGDSFADAIFLALRARGSALHVVRWSRPAIGLTRDDYFDYAGWLRDSVDLGVADYCVVQIGANDKQGIPAGERKWLFFPTEEWQAEYRRRVAGIIETLRMRHCRQILWILQPESRPLINALQRRAAADGALVLDVDAGPGDFVRDGIHFNGPFTLRVAEAVIRAVTAWEERVPSNCYTCHTQIRMEREFAAAELAPLRLSTLSLVAATSMPARAAESARSFTPPKVYARRVRVASR